MGNEPVSHCSEAIADTPTQARTHTHTHTHRQTHTHTHRQTDRIEENTSELQTSRPLAYEVCYMNKKTGPR